MAQSHSEITQNSINALLRSRRQINVSLFESQEAVDNNTALINDQYAEGFGISAGALTDILFGYETPLYNYEGTALLKFGLVATRDITKPRGPLYFVRKEDMGSTQFPIAFSTWHDYYTLSSSELEAFRKAMSSSSSSISSSSESEVSSSSDLFDFNLDDRDLYETSIAEGRAPWSTSVVGSISDTSNMSIGDRLSSLESAVSSLVSALKTKEIENSLI